MEMDQIREQPLNIGANVRKDRKAVEFLKKRLLAISFVLYISGIISFGLLFYEGANIDKTYFSDNALLPGLVNREFTIVPSYLSSLEKSINEDLKKSDRIPVSWLMSTLASTGVETYSQNFTFNYPFGTKPVSTEELTS